MPLESVNGWEDVFNDLSRAAFRFSYFRVAEINWLEDFLTSIISRREIELIEKSYHIVQERGHLTEAFIEK